MQYFFDLISDRRNSSSFVRGILTAVSYVFQAAIRLRHVAYTKEWFSSTRLSVPVISIGNIVVGAISIVGLIAIAIGNSSHFNNSPSLTQRNVDVSTQFKAAPLMESSESTRHHSSRNGYGH